MAKQKTTTVRAPKGVRVPTRKRDSVSKPTAWTNRQKLSIRLALISFFGLVVPAAFANWDKFAPREKSNVNVNDKIVVLTTFLQHRQTKSLALLNQAEANVDDAMKGVEDSNTFSLTEKQSAERAADALKTTIRAFKPQIEAIYDRWRQAVESDNSVESALLQAELLDKFLELQRQFDLQVEPTPLKDYMRDTHFGCNEDKRPRMRSSQHIA